MAEILWLQDHHCSIQWKLIHFFFWDLLRPIDEDMWGTLSILCLNKACWWFKVCSSLRIELDESKTPAEESSLELLNSQESWMPLKCDVSSAKDLHLPKTQGQEQHSCLQHAWEASRATFFFMVSWPLFCHACRWQDLWIRVPTESYGNCWSLEGNIMSNRKKSCPLGEESRWGGSSLTQLYVVLGW